MNRDPSVAGLASLVQSRGRRGDTMLVHMSPEEVQGLQRVALAAGGSLTINPDTGLVEANFLKKLLPTLLGVGLNFLFPGLGAIGSGLLVGGVEAARTGDLGKGLMAGLGAFGGAGLGAGLSSAATGGSAALTGVTPTGFVPGTEAFRQAAAAAAPTSAATAFAPTAAAAQMGGTGSFLSSTANPAATVARTAANAAKGGFTDSVTTGIRNLATPAGRTAFMEAIPGGNFGLAAGSIGLANAMTPDYQMPDMTGEIDDSYYQSYGYSPEQGRFLGGQWRKGYPGFPGYAAGGSIMPRTNYDYPQAGITKSSYAPSLDYTQPQEVVDGYEVKLDPFTGEERFANGGEVGIGALVPPPPIIDPGPQEPLPTTPLPEEPVYATAAPSSVSPMIAQEDPNFYKRYSSQVQPNDPSGADRATLLPFMDPDRDIRYGGPGARPDYGPPMLASAAAPQQSLEQYYQGLLAPPQQRPADDSFMNYMRSLNNYVTSPVAPPPPPPQPPQTPPANPPGDPRVTGTGGTGTGMRWDPTQGKFVPGTGSPGDTGIDLAELQNLVNSGMFSGFNFGDLGNYLQNGGYGDTSGLTWDPVSGSFRQPGSQTVNTPPGTATEDQFKFDPNNFQNPFVDGFDMSSLPGYNQPFQYDFSGMGDMGGYGTQFQGFQPQSTDFGSTYQAPAMNLPTFDASAYAPQQMDFGSMGYGLGSLPTIASTYQPQTVATPTFDTSSFQMPASQSPMMTGGDTGMSNVSTAPQFGFGNSDVLYGQSNFGQGGEQNIFGFAEGGAIQRAAAGKLITGDGDGMSDDIRANINGNQEARLADGEFVIPADVVSHLGNGSTDAGADQLHAMMDRIRKARTGRTRQAPEIDPDEYMPA